MMYNVEDREWKAFSIGGKDGLFKLISSSSNIDKSRLNCASGDIPYITRTEFNNGTKDFVTDDQNVVYKIDEGNVITIGSDTQTVFYQPYMFYTGDNVKILSSDKVNELTALFLKSVLDLQMKKFNWGGNGATLGRLIRTKIMLPVDSLGNPDWEFMENFMRERIEVKEYGIVECSLSEVDDTVPDNLAFDGLKWGIYRIGDLFDIKRGKRHIARDRTKGCVPYYSASGVNNGVTDWISNPLFVAEDAMVVSTFCNVYFAEGKFTCSDEMSILINSHLNKYNARFIANMLSVHKSKYGFGRKLFSNRLINESVTLPVDASGNPDWEFMENYMKMLEQRQIKQVLDFHTK